MRDIDVRECAAFGHTPKAALREAILNSDKAWTALVDDRPEAIFGVVVNSALTGQGAPWFLGTDVVWQHARALLVIGPAIVARLHDSSESLAGYVSVENAAAIRMLKRWGFDVGQDRRRIGGVPFYGFERSA
ncbi:hypothetical protein [Sphingopyxis macrogoltabida]|nr:hypothetical protein [Sphingopyxis macrogoltabida]